MARHATGACLPSSWTTWECPGRSEAGVSFKCLLRPARGGCQIDRKAIVDSLGPSDFAASVVTRDTRLFPSHLIGTASSVSFRFVSTVQAATCTPAPDN